MNSKMIKPESDAERFYKTICHITKTGDSALVKTDRTGKLTIRKIDKAEVNY